MARDSSAFAREHNDISVVEGAVAQGDKVVVEGQVRLAPGLSVKEVE